MKNAFIVLIFGLTFLGCSNVISKKIGNEEIGTTLIKVESITSFPFGMDNRKASVDNAYWLGETEVPYSLWKEVFMWATRSKDNSLGAGDYSFAYAGTAGSGHYTPDHPVTNISWRDAMIWCNALTEWHNSNVTESEQLSCVYYIDAGFTNPIRTCDREWPKESNHRGVQDRPYIKADATGFRLPTPEEWELAARWRNNSNSSVPGYSNPYFTEEWAFSGTPSNWSEDDVFSKAMKEEASLYSWGGKNMTSPIRLFKPNDLGFYDMSANASEWCYTDVWMKSKRVSGGSFTFPIGGVGDESKRSPHEKYSHIGFRIAQSVVE